MANEYAPRPLPDEFNLEAFVARQWEIIRHNLNNGFPYQTYIDSIELRLKAFEQARKLERLEGLLGAGFDWDGDYARARGAHSVNLHWIDHGINSRKAQIEWWEGYVARIEDYGTKLAQSGLGLIFAFHGAVVLGCMKILSEKASPSPLLTEARWGFALGMTGILMVGIGKLA
jgi:hypothetical protein